MLPTKIELTYRSVFRSHMRNNCPGGHGLTKLKSWKEGWYCNTCP